MLARPALKVKCELRHALKASPLPAGSYHRYISIGSVSIEISVASGFLLDMTRTQETRRSIICILFALRRHRLK